MPGKVKIEIKETECEIACTNHEGMRSSEYIEMAAMLVTLAAERSSVDIRYAMELTEKRVRYMYDKNRLDELEEKVQTGLEKTPKV